MSTTSLKLPDEIKERAVSAALRLGISPHAFMVSAIDQATTIAEQRAEFVAAARSARDAMMKAGRGFPADEVHAYLKARAAGKKASRPKAKPWRS
jgi:predicted transcriptional regulator